MRWPRARRSGQERGSRVGRVSVMGLGLGAWDLGARLKLIASRHGGPRTRGQGSGIRDQASGKTDWMPTSMCHRESPQVPKQSGAKTILDAGRACGIESGFAADSGGSAFGSRPVRDSKARDPTDGLLRALIRRSKRVRITALRLSSHSAPHMLPACAVVKAPPLRARQRHATLALYTSGLRSQLLSSAPGRLNSRGSRRK